MTKKHFDAIAAALHESKPDNPDCFASLAEREQWEKTARQVLDAIDRVCPNLNRTRFANACGLNERTA